MKVADTDMNMKKAKAHDDVTSIDGGNAKNTYTPTISFLSSILSPRTSSNPDDQIQSSSLGDQNLSTHTELQYPQTNNNTSRHHAFQRRQSQQRPDQRQRHQKRILSKSRSHRLLSRLIGTAAYAGRPTGLNHWKFA